MTAQSALSLLCIACMAYGAVVGSSLFEAIQERRTIRTKVYAVFLIVPIVVMVFLFVVGAFK